MVDVILGLQWGDEGKGKIVDYFAPQYDVIARFQGGPNAGHTLYVNGTKMVLHQIPSGIFHQDKINIIGNGVVLDPVTLKKECDAVAAMGVDVRKNLFISERTNIIVPSHRALDKASELSKGESKIGSTLKGIGPAYSKYIALRMKHQKILDSFHFNEDIGEMENEFFEAIEFLKTLNIINCEYFINDQIKKGKKILAEGAQGSMLDIDFGTFPFVTSSNTISAGVCTGLGISPKLIGEVYGISKAYCTRVGSGPFPTELHDAKGEELRKIGSEFGATTGRPRRCGWIDLVALKFACMINGVTQIIMTKADILDSFQELELGVAYEMEGKQIDYVPFQIVGTPVTPIWKKMAGWNTDSTAMKNVSELPATMQSYIQFINEYLGVPVKYVSNGPGRDQIIHL
jgi:adenylosuccinate synthase